MTAGRLPRVSLTRCLYDALDTAIVMEETDVADHVVGFLAQGAFSIRYPGGALSAYQLRGQRDPSLLALAWLAANAHFL